MDEKIEFVDKDGKTFTLLKRELLEITQAIFKSEDTYLNRCINCKKALIWIHGRCNTICEGIEGMKEFESSECWECKGLFCKKCAFERDLRECNSTECKHMNLNNEDYKSATGECYLFACKICRDLI